MSDKRFLNLSIHPKGDLDYAAIETTLNSAKDWIRYSPSSYLLWTGRSVDSWHKMLRANDAMRPHTYLLFAADLSDRQGWISKDVWDWIRKYEDANPYKRRASGNVLNVIATKKDPSASS